MADTEKLINAGDYLYDALETFVLITHCECDPCPECGKMPIDCSGTECSKRCSCNECDHCHAEEASKAWRDAKALIA